MVPIDSTSAVTITNVSEDRMVINCRWNFITLFISYYMYVMKEFSDFVRAGGVALYCNAGLRCHLLSANKTQLKTC